MPDLTQALLVPFAAGFVVQRFLEIIDPFTTGRISDPNRKKFVMGVISVILGWLLAGFGHIEIFSQLCVKDNPCADINQPWDVIFSGIFISAGTEGFNSLMKFAGYKKEASKADAARKKSGLNQQQLNLVNPQS